MLTSYIYPSITVDDNFFNPKMFNENIIFLDKLILKFIW